MLTLLIAVTLLSACSNWRGVADETDWKGTPKVGQAQLISAGPESEKPSERRPKPKANEGGEPAKGEIQVIEAVGVGRSQKEAIEEAQRAAVAQVVGSMVRAEDRVLNDRVIRSEVLAFANGFVKRFEVIGKPQMSGGNCTVRIKADVQRERLTVALNDHGVRTATVDVRSMAGQADTIRERRDTGLAMARSLFRDFPNNVCDVGIIYQQPIEKRGNDLVIEVGIRVSVHPERWDAWCREADRVLGAICTNCGPIPWNVDTHHWSDKMEDIGAVDPKATEPFQNVLMLGKRDEDGYRGRYVNIQPEGELQATRVVDWAGKPRQERNLLSICDAWSGGSRGYVLPDDIFAPIRAMADRVLCLEVQLVDATGRSVGRPITDWTEIREPELLGDTRKAVFDGGRVGRPEVFVTRRSGGVFAAGRLLYAPARWYGGQRYVPPTTIQFGNNVITTAGHYVDIVQPALLPARGFSANTLSRSPQLMLIPCFTVNGAVGQVVSQQLVLPFRFTVDADLDILQATVSFKDPIATPWDQWVHSGSGTAPRGSSDPQVQRQQLADSPQFQAQMREFDRTLAAAEDIDELRQGILKLEKMMSHPDATGSVRQEVLVEMRERLVARIVELEAARAGPTRAPQRGRAAADRTAGPSGVSGDGASSVAEGGTASKSISPDRSGSSGSTATRTAPKPSKPAAKPPPPAATPRGSERSAEVLLGGRSFSLEVVSSDAARTKGLAGRESMPDGTGMLFVFPKPAVHTLSMAGCMTAVDVAFLDKGGRVLSVHSMQLEPPQGDMESRDAYLRRVKRSTSKSNASYAVVVQGGTMSRLQVKVGDTIRIDLAKLSGTAR